MLLSDLQTLLGRHLGQSRSNLFGPEQCEAFASEPVEFEAAFHLSFLKTSSAREM